jgi:DNA-binding NarL/FixJ family response regulator
MRHQPSPPSIRVLVCDDTRVHTELLADALRRDSCLQVNTTLCGADGIAYHANLHDFDVLLLSSNLDQRSDSGFEVLRGLRTAHADLKAVMLLDASQGEMILQAFRSGARGIFHKDDSIETLGKCLRKVHEGQIWANSEQIETLINALASSHNIRAVDARGLNLLSKREMEIVRGVAQGLSNREIAERLHLSQHTIKNSLFRIFDKLGASSRVELLFMTLSQERHAQSTVQQFTEEDAYESLSNEAVRMACQEAASRGILMAQIALAQFHAKYGAVSNSALEAYVWYLVTTRQISQLCSSLVAKLSPEELVRAEELANERLRVRNEITPVSRTTRSERRVPASHAPREARLLLHAGFSPST